MVGFFTQNAEFGGATLYSPYMDQDSFVAKFSSNGTHVWSKSFWNTSTDMAYAVAADDAGDVAVTGFFAGSLDAGTGVLRARKNDIYVAKLGGADGHTVWAKGFGGLDVDRGQAVAFDQSGNVVIGGLIYNGSVDFGGGALTTGYDQDGFVAKLTGATGAHVWSKRLGGAGSDGVTSVAADEAGAVVVNGYFQGSADFGGGVVTSAGNASADMFVASYASSGSHRWSHRFGGVSADGWQGGHVAVDDATNQVVVTSSFQGTADFAGGSLTSAGSDDVCITKLNP